MQIFPWLELLRTSETIYIRRACTAARSSAHKLNRKDDTSDTCGIGNLLLDSPITASHVNGQNENNQTWIHNMIQRL